MKYLIAFLLLTSSAFPACLPNDPDSGRSTPPFWIDEFPPHQRMAIYTESLQHERWFRTAQRWPVFSTATTHYSIFVQCITWAAFGKCLSPC